MAWEIRVFSWFWNFFVEEQNVLDTFLQLASLRIKISLSTACEFFEFVFATVTYCENSWQTV